MGAWREECDEDPSEEEYSSEEDSDYESGDEDDFDFAMMDDSDVDDDDLDLENGNFSSDILALLGKSEDDIARNKAKIGDLGDWRPPEETGIAAAEQDERAVKVDLSGSGPPISITPSKLHVSLVPAQRVSLEVDKERDPKGIAAGGVLPDLINDKEDEDFESDSEESFDFNLDFNLDGNVEDIDTSKMSANLLAMLGYSDLAAKRCSADAGDEDRWVPPERSGLANSKAIIELSPPMLLKNPYNLMLHAGDEAGAHADGDDSWEDYDVLVVNDSAECQSRLMAHVNGTAATHEAAAAEPATKPKTKRKSKPRVDHKPAADAAPKAAVAKKAQHEPQTEVQQKTEPVPKAAEAAKAHTAGLPPLKAQQPSLPNKPHSKKHRADHRADQHPRGTLLQL